MAETRAQRVGELSVAANQAPTVQGTGWQCTLLGQQRGSRGRTYADSTADWLGRDRLWFRWRRGTDEQLVSMQLNNAMDQLAIPLPAGCQPVSTKRTERVQALLGEAEKRCRGWTCRVLGQKAARGWEGNVAEWTKRTDVWFEWRRGTTCERVTVLLDGMNQLAPSVRAMC